MLPKIRPVGPAAKRLARGQSVGVDGVHDSHLRAGEMGEMLGSAELTRYYNGRAYIQVIQCSVRDLPKTNTSD